MKYTALILAALAAILTAAAAPVRTATENFVTNKIAEAEARTAAAITAATNAIPRPDLTPATNYVDALETRITSGQVVADRARVAQEAESAYVAGRADTATTASSAETATRAQSAAEADSAQYADTAGRADEASWADHAVFLDDGSFQMTITDVLGEIAAATNAIPRSAGVDAEAVTNIVRDISLGGIWDETLGIWWTPRMRNGSLTYEATTNVNLNAEN